MILSSDLTKFNNTNREQFHKFLQIFDQIIDILKGFEDNYEKKLNFTKLVKIINIPDIYTDKIISLILKSQQIFHNIFLEYNLEKKKENSILYLIAEKKIPDIIIFTSFEISHYNDIIYTFKYINRGKGFDISKNGTEFLYNLKLLNSKHPFLFEIKDNGLIYPSRFGMELGDLIISYNKGNKKITHLFIENHRILVKDDE
ncbi:MAG: hypothetical protein ACFFCE_19460 [Promethearchaeota archaeon]